MKKPVKVEDHSAKIHIALDKTIEGVIAETKAIISYLFISGKKKGNRIKIPAKDL